MIDFDKNKALGKRKILIFENTYTLTEYLLEKWIEIARESVQRNNRFTVALSGGRSPMEFYCRLSNLKEFDLWQRTHIFLGDERFVPLDDDSSNFKMLKKSLLDYISIPPENVRPIKTNQKNVEISAEEYKNELAHFFEFKEAKTPCFDFMLLGIGTDGHTASLFPNDPRVYDTDRLVLPVSLPQLKEERVSLTLPVINNSRNIFTLVCGANKADIFQEILANSHLPITSVSPSSGQLIYLLDKEAAQKLSYHDSYLHEGNAICYEPIIS